MNINILNEQLLMAKAEAAQAKLQRIYPTVKANNFLFIDNSKTRIAIDDLSYRARKPIGNALDALVLSCRGWLEIFDATVLAQNLSLQLENLLTNSRLERSAFIFPGKGSIPVADLLSKTIRQEIFGGVAKVIKAPTQRIVNAATGAVEGVKIGDAAKIKQSLSDRTIEKVMVLDDVIATGTTLNAFRKLAPSSQPDWTAAAFMTLAPSQNRARSKNSPSGVDGYQAILTVNSYQGLSGTPALNSLSNLIGDSPKSQMVRSRYMERYVEDAEQFADSINQIKGALEPR